MPALFIAALLACAVPWRACYYFAVDVRYPQMCACGSAPGRE